MMKKIRTASGHELTVTSVEGALERASVPALANKDNYPTLYRVWLAGRVVMYLGKGYGEAPREIVAWYPNGRMWSSFGDSLKSTVEGAMKDAWLYIFELESSRRSEAR